MDQFAMAHPVCATLMALGAMVFLGFFYWLASRD